MAKNMSHTEQTIKIQALNNTPGKWQNPLTYIMQQCITVWVCMLY